MSAICGVVSLAGHPVSTDELAPMLHSMAGRGPDGIFTWSDGLVAFGYGKLASTPEAVTENMPFTHSESGCTIIADARIDNRDELLPILAAGRPGIGDGELILLAFLRWGDRCPSHLIGNFAFAIWDPRSQSLLIARDHMGVRQVSFALISKTRLVFATEPSAVVSHPALERQLNVERVADLLDDLEALDPAATMFSGVDRLRRAHFLRFSSSGLSEEEYWRLVRPEELRFADERDYSAALIDQLQVTLKPMLRVPGPIGSMLSGGIDSTSIVAMAAEALANEGRGPLHTFSVIGPDASDCRETQAILASLSIPGIEPHLYDYSNFGDAAETLSRMALEVLDPFDSSASLLRVIYWAAAKSGVPVVLDGVTADLALGPHSHIPRLLKRGRVLQAMREARLEQTFWNGLMPIQRNFWMSASRAYVPLALRRARRAAHAALRDLQIDKDTLLREDFARAVDIRGRRRRRRWKDRDFDRLDRDERVRRMSHLYLTASRERLDRLSGNLGVEARDPFIDIRFLDFCLSLPERFLQRDGWPKILLRRAMEGRVPEAVLWRRGKDHLGGKVTQALLTGPSHWPRNFGPEMKPFVDFARISAQGGTHSRPLDSDQVAELLCLESWIRRYCVINA